MNLKHIRLLGRRREYSNRFEVGDSRWQELQILLLESLVFSSVACVESVIEVYMGSPFFYHALYGDSFSPADTYWYWDSFVFVAKLSALTCALTVMVPATRLLRTDINSGLKDGGPATGESRRAGRFRTLLVILQASFAVILLIGTGLMVRSFQRIQSVDLGFDPVGKMKVWVQFPRGYELNENETLQLYERLKEKLSMLPGVLGVSYAEDAILGEGQSFTERMQMEDGTFKNVMGSYVAADFQQVAGLRMQKGRWLSGKSGVREIVINETFARTRFGDKDPVGQSIKAGDAEKEQNLVVGVVGDVRESIHSRAGMWFYAPAWQRPSMLNTLVLRLDRDPKKEFTGLIRKTIYETNPRLHVESARSVEQADKRINVGRANRVHCAQGPGRHCARLDHHRFVLGGILHGRQPHARVWCADGGRGDCRGPVPACHAPRIVRRCGRHLHWNLRGAWLDPVHEEPAV